MEVKTNVKERFFLCSVPRETEDAQYFVRPSQEITPGNGVVILRDGGSFVLVRSAGGIEGWVPRRCLCEPFEVSCLHQRRDGLNSSRLSHNATNSEDGPVLENGERVVLLDVEDELLKVRAKRWNVEGWIHRKYLEHAPPLSWKPRIAQIDVGFLTHRPRAKVRRRTLLRGPLNVALTQHVDVDDEVQMIRDGGSELLVLTSGGVEGWIQREDVVEPFIVHAVHHRRDGVTATRLRKRATHSGDFVPGPDAMIENGEDVQVLDINCNFVKVQRDDATGWVQRVHIQCVPLGAMFPSTQVATPLRRRCDNRRVCSEPIPEAESGERRKQTCSRGKKTEVNTPSTY